MKKTLLSIIAFVLLCFNIRAQQSQAIENVIIITTDGFRWQEVFHGMDTDIARKSAFNQHDSSGIHKKYWAPTPEERRKKLLPFLWNTVATNGQIYGNRQYDVKVDNANPYWFSYPGYSEIFCGFVDSAINSNDFPPNPNTNVLEFINKQKGFKGRVAAFGAWSAFNNILNEQRSKFDVICGAELCGGKNPNAQQRLINQMKQDTYNPFDNEEYLDVFTHYAAFDYLTNQMPRVLYISYGETDEWAHEGHYKNYLDAANRVDKWLNDIWNFVQKDPQYKNKTALFITVDHGRGDTHKDKWTSHGSKIPDSHEIWFAAIGPGIAASGEIKSPVQLYQKQFAETIAKLLGMDFTCEHLVSAGFEDLLMKK